MSLAPDTLWFPKFWLFLSKRKRSLDPEDKENDSRQSSPFNTVDSVVNFGIKYEASDDDDSDKESKTLTPQ